MKSKLFRTVISLLLVTIITITSCISASATSGVWVLFSDSIHGADLEGQCEFSPHTANAQCIVRARTKDGHYVSQHCMFTYSCIWDITQDQLAATTGYIYNNYTTSSMSNQATVTNAGYYRFYGKVGVYSYTNSSGNKVFNIGDVDAGSNTFIPGYYSSLTPPSINITEAAYEVNSKGQTYGIINEKTPLSDYPDMIKARGNHGTSGYILSNDICCRDMTEEGIEAYMEAVNSGEKDVIPLYDSEGNIIDTFTLSRGETSYSN